MACTIVSRNYQIVIPREVREQLGLRPGQEVEVVVEGGIAHLVPGDLPGREGAGKRAAVTRSALSRRILERRHGEPLPDSTAFIRAERERLAARGDR
jgi:AbrB family looped-hinge helix DNA binding protein